MAVKIAGIVHSTPYNLPSTTKCGAEYDPSDRYKSGAITCETCRQMSTREFLAGWEEAERKHPERFAAMDREAQLAELD